MTIGISLNHRWTAWLSAVGPISAGRGRTPQNDAHVLDPTNAVRHKPFDYEPRGRAGSNRMRLKSKSILELAGFRFSNVCRTGDNPLQPSGELRRIVVPATPGRKTPSHSLATHRALDFASKAIRLGA